MNDAEVKLQVKIDDTKATSSISGLKSKMEGLSSTFTNVGKKMTTGITAPIVALGGIAVKNASDLGETMNKVEVAFGDSADSVKEWSKTSIKSYGMAQGTALDMAALFGDMATGMGVNQDEASKLSTNLTGLAGDLASFKNISIDVAKTALAGVFTGETESLKKLGIIMTQTNLEQYALSKGITKSMNDMTEAEKIQLRYSFVVDRSKNAVGDFVRTNDSTANQTRMAGEQFKELAATLGLQLLPIVNAVLGKLSEFMTWLSSLNPEQQKWLLIILGIVAAIGPLLMILGMLIPAIAAIASPIGLIVLAIVGLIAAFAYLMAKSKTFRDNFMYLFNGIKNFIMGFVDIVRGLLNGDMGQVIEGLKRMFTGLKNVVISVLNILIGALNIMIKAALSPLNAVISGLNKIPGVNIKKISLSIPKIPKLETGTNYVPNDGLAYLHQGEAVVPKKYNPAMSGGQNVAITMNAPDIYLDGNKVGKSMTPYITKTVKLGGGNI